MHPWIDNNTEPHVKLDFVRGNVAKDVPPAQVTPTAQSSPPTSIESMPLPMPLEQIMALMKAAEAWLRSVAWVTVISPNMELFPTNSIDDDTRVDVTDTNTSLEACEDMLGMNVELLGQCGGRMDSQILRQVKLTSECIKKQTQIVNMACVVTSLIETSHAAASRASSKLTSCAPASL